METTRTHDQKKKKTKKRKVSSSSENNWNQACTDLLDTSVKSTWKLEKSLKKKKNLTRRQFDDKIHNELLVVQLNAWVCAISTASNQYGATSVEQQFLQDYSARVQDRNL